MTLIHAATSSVRHNNVELSGSCWSRSKSVWQEAQFISWATDDDLVAQASRTLAFRRHSRSGGWNAPEPRVVVISCKYRSLNSSSAVEQEPIAVAGMVIKVNDHSGSEDLSPERSTCNSDACQHAQGSTWATTVHYLDSWVLTT